MFWHNLKYDLICTFRTKSFLFWLLAFPIILGTLFHVAFANIYETDTLFNSIPVAIVENQKNEIFNNVIDSIVKEDEPLLKAEYLSEKDALKKLEKNDISGIIYLDKEITLKISDKGDKMKQTILREFLNSYRTNEAIITDTAMNAPEKIQQVMAALTEEISCNENIKLTDGNMDVYVQYFYNLIAMVAFFGSITGLHIAIGNQGNLSQIAARKCISPTHKLISLTSNLIASCAAQIVCVVISITYIMFVLGENLGDKIPLIYLSGIVGAIAGVTCGFFIGSIGRMSESIKSSISMSVTMVLCFFSGLMVGNMKVLVEEHFPILNRVSPVALICDMFYCLNVYDNYDRYIEKLVSLIIISVIFTIGGFLLTRRKKYASI